VSYNGQCCWQCKAFAQKVDHEAGGNLGTCYRQCYLNEGIEISWSQAGRGDFIQLSKDGDPECYYRKGMHTAIVLQNYGNGTFQVVDSNYCAVETVCIHDWNPFNQASQWGLNVHFYRLGRTDCGTCSAPSLNSPNDGYVHTSSDRTITFSWSPPSNCTPDGYTFRVKTVATMDSGGTTIFDEAQGGTQVTKQFGSQWDNTDLYWSVRACKPCTPFNPGPWAPSRRFRIEPGAETHLECRSDWCVRVSGPGSDQCSPEGSYCPPPSGNWHAKYFDNQECQDPNCTTTPRCEEDFAGPFIDKLWVGADAPCGMNGDYWGALFTGRFDFPGGDYVFHIDHDDGARLFLDGQCIQEVWNDTGLHHACPPRYLSEEHDVAVAYRENTGDAKLHLWWDTDASYCEPEDTTPPTGRITSPSSGSATNSCPITIQAEASDDQSGVNLVEFHVMYDLSWHHIGNDSTWPYSISWDCSGVSDQEVWLTIHILDNAGNEAMDPGGYVYVTLDRQTPSGTITSPQQGGYLNADNIAITASAQDAESGVKEVQFFVGYDDGTGWDWHHIATDSNGGDGWSATWDASQVNDQLVAFWIYVFDHAGNLASDSIGDVALDRTPPSSWVDPLPEFQETTSFEVSWSHDADLSGIREYWVQYRYGVSGMWQTWYAGSDTSAMFQYADVGVTYYFQVRAIDNAGNEEEYPGGDGDTHTTILLPCEDFYEPDDSPAEASWISRESGIPQTHRFCVAGDEDWVWFYPVPEIAYIIETSNLGPDADTVLYLYDVDGSTLLVQDDDSGQGYASRIEWTFPAEGTYYAKVRCYSNCYGPDTNYDLSVREAVPVPCEDPWESDNSPAEANWISVDGTTQTHRFCEMSDHDWVKFNAVAGVTYVIQASDLGFDALIYLDLYDADGATSLAGDSCGYGETCQVEWTFDSTGTYYVMIEMIEWHDSGPHTNYDISVTGQLQNRVFLPIIMKNH